MPNSTTPALQLNLTELLNQNKVMQTLQLGEINTELEKLNAHQRIQWAYQNLSANFAVSSSFGLQSAVMLHLVTEVDSTVPVILTDTGYLFKETYSFIDELTDKLHLNLKVYRSAYSPAWQEARYGNLWEQGLDGIKRYNQINKVEPLRRALKELNVQTWFSGLRREQSSTRRSLPILSIQHGVFKFLPIVDWNDEDVDNYLKRQQLPYHPLKEQGYVSIGDTHTTRKLEDGMTQEETRFFGLKRECGLHEDDYIPSDGSGI